jgi:hypothetical protein
MPQTPVQKLLHHAAGRIGAPALAARMKVQEALLETWMNGQAVMPAANVLVLAAIIDQLRSEPR